MAKPKLSGSNSVAAGIFLSRIAGLVREQAIVVVLGFSATASAFRFAMRIPNLLQNLLGEGALSASFIPVYAKLVEDGKTAAASKLAKQVVTWLAGITTLIVAGFVIFAEQIVRLFTSWESDAELLSTATTLVQITSVGIGFLVASAWCLGIQNSHRKFFLSYVAPTIWNLVQIAVLAFAIIRGLGLTTTGTALGIAVIVGSFAQLAVQLPTTFKLLGKHETDEDISGYLGDVARRFLPAVGARGVIQISSYVDTALAAAVSVATLSLYAASLPLYLLPISLFAFSIAAAELAEMSRISDSIEQVQVRLTAAMRKVSLPAAFTTVLFLTSATLIVDGLYGFPRRIINSITGDDAAEAFFGPDQTLVIGIVLATFAIGLPAAMRSRIVQNTLYSLGDVKGPAKIAIFRLIAVLGFSSLLMFQLDWAFVENQQVDFSEAFEASPYSRVAEDVRLDEASSPRLGAVGLALGASLASWVEYGLLLVLLKRKGLSASTGQGTKIAIAALTAGAVMLGVRLLEFLPSPIDIAIVGLLGLATFYGVLRAFGINLVAALRS